MLLSRRLRPPISRFSFHFAAADFSLGESDSAIFRLIDIFSHSVDILLSICVTVIILLWGLRIRVAERLLLFS